MPPTRLINGRHVTNHPEIVITELYRGRGSRPNIVILSDGSVFDLNSRMPMRRSSPSRNASPPVHHMRLGENARGPNPYNHASPRLSLTPATWVRLLGGVVPDLPGPLGRLTDLLTLPEFLENYMQSWANWFAGQNGGIPQYQGYMADLICNGGGGAASMLDGFAYCGSFIVDSSLFGYFPFPAATFWTWTNPSAAGWPYPPNYVWAQAGARYVRTDSAAPYPPVLINSGNTSPTPYPPMNPFGQRGAQILPNLFGQPNPNARPSFSARYRHSTPSDRFPRVMLGDQTWNGPPRPPPTRPTSPDGHQWRPPPRGTKEKKGVAAQGMGIALKAALAATEANDALDALWEALPAHIRARTPRSGVTGRTARNPGTRFSTPLDRAMHLWRNLQHLNLSDAARNLLINHFVDNVLGGLNRGADGARRRAGGTAGWGMVS